MVRGSRFIPAFLGEIKVNSVRQVQSSENSAHGSMTFSQGEWVSRNASGRHQCATTKHEQPAQQFDSPMHEETRRMQSAAVKQHPESRERPSWEKIPAWAQKPQQPGD